MDITGIDIAAGFTAAASFVGACGAAIKAFGALKQAKEAQQQVVVIQRERKTQSELRDSQIVRLQGELKVVKSQLANHDHRLDEGNARFDALQLELKETNGLLRETLGAIKVKLNLPIGTTGL